MSIMNWRVRNSGLPQWYCNKVRSCGLSSAAKGATARSRCVKCAPSSSAACRVRHYVPLRLARSVAVAARNPPSATRA